MVHTKSAIALTVLALGAASTLAAPSYDYSDELALREFEELVEALEARGIEYDYNDYDAREFDFDLEDVDARDLEDYDIREIIEEFDVDARELGFGDDYEFEEREVDEDIVERATSTTSSSSSSKLPSATTTTIVSKPTGKTLFGKKKKETKTVLVTTFKTPKHCKKPGLFSKIKNAFNKKAKKRSQLKHKKNAKESSTTSGSHSSTSTSASATSSASATATASSVDAAAWAHITPPPKKERHGAEYSQKKKVGKDKVTTISRTVTAAATPCPSKDAKKHKRDLEEVESIFEREYSFDQLD